MADGTKGWVPCSRLMVAHYAQRNSFSLPEAVSRRHVETISEKSFSVHGINPAPPPQRLDIQCTIATPSAPPVTPLILILQWLCRSAVAPSRWCRIVSTGRLPKKTSNHRNIKMRGWSGVLLTIIQRIQKTCSGGAGLFPCTVRIFRRDQHQHISMHRTDFQARSASTSQSYGL